MKIRPLLPADQAADLKALVLEKLRRRIDGLKLYRPLPFQKLFHDSNAKEKLVRGSNRCLAGESLLFDPVLAEFRRIDSINEDFHVYAKDGDRLVVAKANAPFCKGVANLYRVSMSNGQEFVSTLDHRILTSCGWLSIRQCQKAFALGLPLSIPASCLLESQLNGRRCSQKPEDSLADCQTGRHFCDEQLRSHLDGDKAFARPPICARERSQMNSHFGGLAYKSKHTHFYRMSAHPSSLYVPGLSLDQLGESECRGALEPCLLSGGEHGKYRRSQRKLACSCNTSLSTSLRSRKSFWHQCMALRSLSELGRYVIEKLLIAQRSLAALIRNSSAESPLDGLTFITSIKFERRDIFYDLHVPLYHNYLFSSIVHHNSGKTTCAAVEFARAVTGQDDRFPKENGLAYMVGKDGKEVSNVMVRLLLRAGAFKIIRDQTTGEWRSYNPSDLSDLLRVKEAKPAPPLIPPRVIKEIAWENRKAGLPSVIRLHTGWEIHCYSSNAKPPHGVQIDLAWFDEEILDPDWYPEISARLVDRNGRFLWSATPQAGTAQLYELHERAERQQRTLPREQRNIEEFIALLADNEHLTLQQKKEFEEKLSPEEVMVRIHGEFAAHGSRVYPEFCEANHECPFFDIPNDWTRYVAIDPGRQICGVLFGAVPAPGQDDSERLYIYDELYIPQCSAEIFGQKMKQKALGQAFQAFIIDHQMSRMHDTGSGRNIEEQYSDALRKYGVACFRTGYDFTWGVADPIGGIEAVREYTRINRTGGSRLKVLKDKCPNFLWEMKRYWYERDRDGRVTDKPRDRGPVHLCACLRYLIQDEPVWVQPRKGKPKPGAVYKKSRELMNPDGFKGSMLNFGPGRRSIGISRNYT